MVLTASFGGIIEAVRSCDRVTFNPGALAAALHFASPDDFPIAFVASVQERIVEDYHPGRPMEHDRDAKPGQARSAFCEQWAKVPRGTDAIVIVRDVADRMGYSLLRDFIDCQVAELLSHAPSPSNEIDKALRVIFLKDYQEYLKTRNPPHTHVRHAILLAAHHSLVAEASKRYQLPFLEEVAHLKEQLATTELGFLVDMPQQQSKQVVESGSGGGGGGDMFLDRIKQIDVPMLERLRLRAIRDEPRVENARGSVGSVVATVPSHVLKLPLMTQTSPWMGETSSPIIAFLLIDAGLVVIVIGYDGWLTAVSNDGKRQPVWRCRIRLPGSEPSEWAHLTGGAYHHSCKRIYLSSEHWRCRGIYWASTSELSATAMSHAVEIEATQVASPKLDGDQFRRYFGLAMAPAPQEILFCAHDNRPGAIGIYSTTLGKSQHGKLIGQIGYPNDTATYLRNAGESAKYFRPRYCAAYASPETVTAAVKQDTMTTRSLLAVSDSANSRI